MNATVLNGFSPAPVCSQGEIDRLTLHIIRSFAALDLEVEHWLHECGKGDPRVSSGQRLQSITSCVAMLKATQRQRDQIQQRSADLTQALSIRNALVHGHAFTGVIGNQPYIFVRTLDQAFGAATLMHCFTVADVESAILKVDQMQRGLFAWRKQRGSPADGKSAEAPAAA